MYQGREFFIKNPRQLKDRIKNISKERQLFANTLLQNYMMERLLERISTSKYCDNFILKGGFLIASMMGIDMRSTMDLDTTVRGLIINQLNIVTIISEILTEPINDGIKFDIKSISPIKATDTFDCFRFTILATFETIKVNLKLDITMGDVLVPAEINYEYKLMFENRSIKIKAYHLYTILAEKIESILARNIANTRARDYYDVYILLSNNANTINKSELLTAIIKKSQERNTYLYIENHEKYLSDIRNSPDLFKLWDMYRKKYPYASKISFTEILDCLDKLFE